jgi:exopolyphosphatase/guanosine-5'-triphosphate,3'-diphosphate pyrophosphatase
MKIATMDIGSNTVRLLLGDITGGQLRRDTVQRQITRLAGGFQHGRYHPTSFVRTVQAVREFANRARAFGAVEIRAVCTGITRKADDPRVFLKALLEEAGLSVVMIEGKVEARLSALGAVNELGIKDQPITLMDVGGFSTEFAHVRGAELLDAISLELGGVSFTEKYLLTDPPASEQVDACAEAIGRVLRDNTDLARFGGPPTLVGTAGTVTTLAAMDLKMERYEPYRLNRHLLSREAIGSLLERMLPRTAIERLSMPGLEKGREDVIVAGALICLAVLKFFQREEMLVTEGGVLEGLAYWATWPVDGFSIDRA